MAHRPQACRLTDKSLAAKMMSAQSGWLEEDVARALTEAWDRSGL
jgi:hypothetical protein